MAEALVLDQNDIILNCTSSRETNSDWGTDQARKSGRLDYTKNPVERDYSTEDDAQIWWKIENQLTSGACVGYAVGGVLKWYFYKAGRVRKGHRLSARYIWMASKELDDYVGQATTFIESEGTSLKTALKIARKFGVVTEKFFPTWPEKGGLYQGSVDSFYNRASQLRINSFYNLVELSERQLTDKDPGRVPLAEERIRSFSDALRRWLHQNGPVMVRFNLNENWLKVTAENARFTKYSPLNTIGGHCAAIVGFKSDGNSGYWFKVRNSWGQNWGDNGYAWVDETYAWMAFTEAYGVWVQIGMPIDEEEEELEQETA